MCNKNIIITFQRVLNKQNDLDSPHFIWMSRKWQMKNYYALEKHVLLGECGNETQSSHTLDTQSNSWTLEVRATGHTSCFPPPLSFLIQREMDRNCSEDTVMI